MLLPRALLDALLFLDALWTFVAPLLSMLLLLVLVLSLLLLGMLLLLLVLVLSLLLLSMLLLVLVLPLLLLGMLLLLLVLVLPLLLLSMLLLLSVLLLGFGLLVLILLLLGVVLLFAALLLVLCVSRSSNSEKQRQNGCAGDSNRVHMCYLCFFQDGLRMLAQASSCRVHRVADGFTGHKKFHSPVLLPTSRVVVRGHWQAITEASG